MNLRHEIDPARLQGRTSAFPYQREALAFVRELPFSAIFYEQGLGKTKIAIDLTLFWLKANRVESVLIVTKKGLVKNWLDEFDIHSHVVPRVISTDRAANHRAIFSPARIFIAGYESIKVEEVTIARFCQVRRLGIILDESQKLKNPASLLTQCFFRISPLFPCRVIMTGTPMANRPYDIWSQIFFLDEGKALGTDFEEFKAKLELPKTNATSDYLDELQSVFPRIESFAARQTKAGSGLKLPGKVFERVQATWEPRQRAMYDQVRTQLRAEIVKDGRHTIDSADDVVKRLLRLVQIASNPATIDESYTEKPGKVAALDQILSAIRSNNEKAIIWTSFVPNCTYLKNHLHADQAVQVNGRLSIAARNASIEKFKKDDSVRFLVATPAAAKEGLTLTVANHAIFFDRSFSLDDYSQAQDRIHRISQSKQCYIYNIELPDSIDEWIDALISVKDAAAKIAMGDGTEADLESLEGVDLEDILNVVLSQDP